MNRPDRARAVTVTVVLAAVAAAVVTQSPRRAHSEVSAAVDRVPPPTNQSAAWYCAAGSGGAPGGVADETIVIANAARARVRAIVEVLPGGQKPAIVRVIDVAGRSQVSARVADIAPASNGGVVVETFGGDVAVEHVLESGRDFAVGPCTRTASDHWYFAHGTTARDAKEVLAIFNPFGDDAVVDIAFATDEGMKRPPALRAVTVPSRSRVTIAPADHIARQENVAAVVTARRGRVVVERTLHYDGSAGRSGFSVATGATHPENRAVFAEGTVFDGVSESVVVFNPADTDNAVSVRVFLDNGQALSPQDVALPARATVTVDVAAKVPKGVGHAIDVRGVEGPLVVEQVVFSKPPAPRIGFETVRGAGDAARRWLFAAGRADAVRDEWLSVWNPGRTDSPVAVYVLAGGQLLVPEKLHGIVVPAGRRVALRLGDSLQRADTAVVLVAAQPVFAERGLYGDGFALGFGLPYPSGRAAR